VEKTRTIEKRGDEAFKFNLKPSSINTAIKCISLITEKELINYDIIISGL
jgi:hypothetical protein